MKLLKFKDNTTLECEDNSTISNLIFKIPNFGKADEIVNTLNSKDLSLVNFDAIEYKNFQSYAKNTYECNGCLWLNISSNIDSVDIEQMAKEITELQLALAELVNTNKL